MEAFDRGRTGVRARHGGRSMGEADRGTQRRQACGEALSGRRARRPRSGARVLCARDGAADLAVGSSLFWSAQVPELNVIGLPWIVPDAKALDALVAGAVKERLDAAIERAGAVPLAYAPLGLRSLATTAIGAQTPDDLKGLKVRIASTPLVADLLIALGAQPRDDDVRRSAGGVQGRHARRAGRHARDLRRRAVRRARRSPCGAVGRGRRRSPSSR